VVSSMFRVNLVDFFGNITLFLCCCSVLLSDFAKIQLFLFWLAELQHVFLSVNCQ
jgi:hypothetical protein